MLKASLIRSKVYQISAGKLTIRTANVSASGIYQCMARNTYGSFLSTSNVDIKEGKSLHFSFAVVRSENVLGKTD